MGANEQPLLLARHRISVADYYRMGDAGVFPPGTHVELIEGEVIDMAAINSRHAASVGRLLRAATTAVTTTVIVQVQNPLRHGVREVWIVDLDARLVRFFRAPLGEGYSDITATETPGLTPIAALPGVAIDLAGVLA